MGSFGQPADRTRLAVNLQDSFHLLKPRRPTFYDVAWRIKRSPQAYHFSGPVGRLWRIISCTPLMCCVSEQSSFSFRLSLVEVSSLFLLNHGRGGGGNLMRYQRQYSLFSSHLTLFLDFLSTRFSGNDGNTSDGHTVVGRRRWSRVYFDNFVKFSDTITRGNLA